MRLAMKKLKVVLLPFGRPFGTVTELFFEKKELIPVL